MMLSVLLIINTRTAGRKNCFFIRSKAIGKKTVHEIFNISREPNDKLLLELRTRKIFLSLKSLCFFQRMENFPSCPVRKFKTNFVA